MPIDLIPNLNALDVAAALLLAHIPFSVSYKERDAKEGAIFDFPPKHLAAAEAVIASLHEVVPDK